MTLNVTTARRVATLLLLVVLAAGSVAAGTADNPEFTDPDDAQVDAVDVRAGWVQEDDESVRLHLRMQALSDPSPIETHTYRWSFRIDTTEYQARATVESDGMGRSVSYALHDAAGDLLATLSGEYNPGSNEILWRIPRDLVGSPVANDTLQAPMATTTATAGSSTVAEDMAPDTCCGATYTFQGPVAGGGNGGGGGDDGGEAPGSGSMILPAALAGLVAIAVVGGYVVKQRSGDLILTSDDPDQPARPGQGANYPLRVENRSGKTRNVELDTEDVPDDWIAFLPLKELRLEPRQAKKLWITLKAPPDAAVGDEAEIGVVARSPDGTTERRVRMRAEVVPEDAAGSTAEE